MGSIIYLNGGKAWSSENIGISWKSSELIEWCRNNVGMVPNPGINLINDTQNRGFLINNVIKSNLTGDRISSFSKLVIHFKSLFHIRGDNSLEQLILNINNKEGWNSKIEFEIKEVTFWRNLELFTDVDKLIQSYKTIIRLILEISIKVKMDKPKVELKFIEENNSSICFTILHKNSIYQKTLQNTINRVGETHSKLIKNQINGLCNLYLKADFGHNQYAEVNLWDGNDRMAVTLDNFHGVEYILKFEK